MPKKKRRSVGRSKPGIKSHPMSRPVLKELGETRLLVGRKRWSEALEKLEDLHRRYPGRPEVLTDLINVCYEIKDYSRYQRYSRELAKLTPNDPEVLRDLAGAYMQNGFQALALKVFRHYLERFPGRPDADKVRELTAELEAGLMKDVTAFGETDEENLELAALNDEVRAAMSAGDREEARQAAQRLLERCPDFVPALNNLSLIDFAEGRVEEAISSARRALSLDPDNFQALGNLARYLYLTGQAEDARELAERLTQVSSNSPELWPKQAETLSYLGDDEGVLEALRGAEQAGFLKQPDQGQALLYHLAAVAALRTGDEKQARAWWRQALKINPHLELARENLDDLNKPVHQRHGPWPFPFENWVPRQAIAGLAKALQSGGRKLSNKAATRLTAEYMKKHPALATTIPILLERGDPEGRRFALETANMAKTPELLAVLKDFTLSQYGSDELRMRAAQIVSEAGMLPAGPVRLWLRGKWQEILLMGIEIHGEPVRKSHSREVEKLMEQAMLALRRNDGKEAETLLKRALEHEPQAVDILNNLAYAYNLQGRIAESEALTRRIHQENPDYFFGRISMAGLYLNQGDIEQAEAMLKPLLSQRRMHFSELSALCSAEIELALAKKMPDTARSWLDMWAQVDPDHPQILRYRLKLGLKGDPSGLHKLLGL